MSTGMPAGIWLTKFGVLVADYFGHIPYHVGSSLKSKDWRDVDVRLILPDNEFTARFGTNQSSCANRKLAAITLAFAALGEQMTGLPIDFQIQSQSHANKAYPHSRSALFELDTTVTTPAPSPHKLTVFVDEMGVHEYFLDCPGVDGGCPHDCRTCHGLVDAARLLDVPRDGGEVAPGVYDVIAQVTESGLVLHLREAL